MRPILVHLPSKALFALGIVLAAVLFGRALLLKRRDPQGELSPIPFLLLGAAWLLLGVRGGAWLPTLQAFQRPWLPLPVYAYGLMLMTSMVVGWFVAQRFARQDGIPSDQAASIYMWTAIWSIVGARLLYVVVQWRDFDGPLEIFMLNRGGLVAYGGMIGGVLASWFACRRRGIPILQWADAAAPSVVLGTAITRIGCLLFGCDYGKVTELPWAVRFPPGSPAFRHHVLSAQLPVDAASSFPVHPTQLYEAAVGLTLFGLLVMLRRRRRFSGQVFLSWVIGYGVMRPVIEVFRDDRERGSVGPLSTSQFIGLTSAVLGLLLLMRLWQRSRRDPTALRLWEAPLPESREFASGSAVGYRR